MEAFKAFNLLLRFLLELASLFALGSWGFRQGGSPFIHWVFGIGLPLLFALAWGRWAAPRSSHRLEGFPRLAFEALAFGSAALSLVLAGHNGQAALFVVVVVLNIVLLRHWKKW